MRDLKNKVFGHWTVVSEAERKNGRMWNCTCKCGTSSIVQDHNLVGGKSIGCIKCKRHFVKHGKADNHRLYDTWKNMRSRTKNPNRPEWMRYGGRGITVCERWNDFSLFLEDMESSFKEGLSLDRIDNDGNYSPDNCKWSTVEEQNSNQSKSLKLFYKGSFYTEARLAKLTGVNRTTIQTRRKAGYTGEGLITPKVIKYSYDGLDYTIKDLAIKFGIKPLTLAYRLRVGYDLDKALSYKRKIT